jgi:hypothetical protein
MRMLMHDESSAQLRDESGFKLSYMNPEKDIDGKFGYDWPPPDSYLGGVDINVMKEKDANWILPMQTTNFIPLLSNIVTETGSSKDITIGTYETEGDFSGNRLVYGNGADDSLSIGELPLTLSDLYYSPGMHLFVLWVLYINYVCKDICAPRYEYIVNKIIDYTCSIYIFMTDLDQQTIIRYVKYGGAFPKSVPFGAIQHSREPNGQALRELSIPFSYNFMDPMNPVVLAEFNKLSIASLIARMLEYGAEEEDARLWFDWKKNTFLGSADGQHWDYAYRFMEAFPAKLPERRFTKKDPDGNLDIYPAGELHNFYQPSSEAANSPGAEPKRGINPTLLNRSALDLVDPWSGVPLILPGQKLIFL